MLYIRMASIATPWWYIFAVQFLLLARVSAVFSFLLGGLKSPNPLRGLGGIGTYIGLGCLIYVAFHDVFCTA